MEYGYVDKTGAGYSRAFNSAEPFSEGVAAVRKCDQASFIDKTGKTVIAGTSLCIVILRGSCEFETLTKDGLLAGYIDKTGKQVWGAQRSRLILDANCVACAKLPARPQKNKPTTSAVALSFRSSKSY